MKTQSPRRARGFTLVELLVVIAIIAVLAGAGFAAGNAAVQKARKTTALASAHAIESAVNNFYNEYGTMPIDPVPASPVNTRTGPGLAMLKVLLGFTDSTSVAMNPRAIKFLSVKEGKANKNGLMYNLAGSDISGLFDPWGGPFHVALDDDYDERVEASPAAGGAMTLNRRVAVWSNGADGAKTGGKAADDVKTW